MPGKNVVERPQLAFGSLAYNTRNGVVGLVMNAGSVGVGHCFRPPGGGAEWNAIQADVPPAPVVDQLRATLTEANARSRGGQRCG